MDSLVQETHLTLRSGTQRDVGSDAGRTLGNTSSPGDGQALEQAVQGLALQVSKKCLGVVLRDMA